MIDRMDDTFVDQLFVCIYPDNKWKIALIGEEIRNKRHNTIVQALVKYRSIYRDIRIDIENIQVFTSKNKFRVEDGERFDLLLGCRPCKVEEKILKSAQIYSKRFFMMPCTCGTLQEKVVEYIRRFPVITHITSRQAGPSKNKRGLYKKHAWMFLYNKPTRRNR